MAAPMVIWDPAMLGYNLGDWHPLHPLRWELTWSLAEQLGVLDGLEFTAPDPATDEELLGVHRPGYLAAVRAASEVPPPDRPGHGLGTDDNPVFPGMHQAAALIAGGSITAARAIASGAVDRAVHIAGGLHHAMANAASGFCVYNDPALAIRALLDAGIGRVAYVDVDVHHGDGVQAAFYQDPRVLTVSIHETPASLWPGTGWAAEIGASAGAGSAVNIPVPAGTGDAQWLRAFHAVVPGLVRAFRPEVLVTQHGADSHAEDPLADLNLTVDGHLASYRALRDLAEQVGGRWLALGGGGYSVVRVVPRSWTHLLAELTGDPLDPLLETAVEWQAHVSSLGATPPRRMTDGADAAFTPWDAPGLDNALDNALDDAVRATRQAVFGHHGLDPNRAA